MPATQPDPEVLIGLFSELPNPASVPQGYFYFATDTIQLFMLKINPTTQARAWVLTSSAGSLPGIPFDQVAVGNATGTGLTSSANFTYDPASGLLTARDTSGKILFTIDGNPATRLLSLFNAAGVSVFSYSTVTSVFAHAVPANPQYFVSNVGSDTNPGTNASPLATVSEALRRLSISGWSGQPVVTVQNSINEGADPSWNTPSPAPGASPILIQGTSTLILAATAPTGGTTGTQFGAVALVTVTSAAPGAANAYRQMFLRFTAGPLAGVRAPIVTNDGAGGFTLAGGQLTAAPVAADLFVVEDVPAIAFTGILRIAAPDGLLLDNFQLSYGASAGVLITAGSVQATAVRHIAGGVAGFLCPVNAAEWREIGIGFILSPPIYPMPAGVLACGSVYDGTASGFNLCSAIATSRWGFGLIEQQSVMARSVDWFVNGGTTFALNLSGLCSLDTCGMFLNAGTVGVFSTLFTNSRKTPGASAVIALTMVTGVFLSISIAATQANSNCIAASGCNLNFNGLRGANGNAGIIPMVATEGSRIQLGALPSITGTVGGNDCVVGANAVNSWNNVFTVAGAANTTDFNAGSSGVAQSQGCRVGP